MAGCDAADSAAAQRYFVITPLPVLENFQSVPACLCTENETCGALGSNAV